MIVDLMRNDLGRVCDYGSVAVAALAVPRPGAGVTHLVSEVTRPAAPGVEDAELLRATFPPGSVTGAPKVQALRVIAELEGSAPRGSTPGRSATRARSPGLELSVAIRTFELTRTRVQLGVGGGITAASMPDTELEECRTKARPLLALGGAEPPPTKRAAGAGAVPAVPVALADGRRRPDPSLGLFETLRIADGLPQRLDAHLERLRAGAQALGLAWPSDTRSQILAAAGELGLGRLRVDLGPDGLAWHPGPLPTPGAPIALAPWVLPGGLGATKWRDRRLVEALTSAAGATPLLLDGDGGVLEAGWATVWIQEGTRLLTPPADGRILPGVTRAALLAEDRRCSVSDLTFERVCRADAIWLSSALRGLVRARL